MLSQQGWDSASSAAGRGKLSPASAALGLAIASMKIGGEAAVYFRQDKALIFLPDNTPS